MYTARVLYDARELLEKKKDAICFINNVIAVLISKKHEVQEEITSYVPSRREIALLDELKFAANLKLSKVVERGWQFRKDYFSILYLINDLTLGLLPESSKDMPRTTGLSSILQLYDKEDALCQNLSSLLTLEIIYTNESGVGYIKASDATPEDFSFDVCASKSNVYVIVTSQCPYDPILSEFVTCTAQISKDEHSPTLKKDLGNSSYKFVFHAVKCCNILLSVQVYGQHVRDSPKLCYTNECTNKDDHSHDFLYFNDIRLCNDIPEDEKLSTLSSNTSHSTNDAMVSETGSEQMTVSEQDESKVLPFSANYSRNLENLTSFKNISLDDKHPDDYLLTNFLQTAVGSIENHVELLKSHDLQCDLGKFFSNVQNSATSFEKSFSNSFSMNVGNKQAISMNQESKHVEDVLTRTVYQSKQLVNKRKDSPSFHESNSSLVKQNDQEIGIDAQPKNEGCSTCTSFNQRSNADEQSSPNLGTDTQTKNELFGSFLANLTESTKSNFQDDECEKEIKVFNGECNAFASPSPKTESFKGACSLQFIHHT